MWQHAQITRSCETHCPLLAITHISWPWNHGLISMPSYWSTFRLSLLSRRAFCLKCLWLTHASTSSCASQLVLVYHLNRQLGIPDELFTFGDDVVLAVLGQLAFMPTLVLAARLCPPGVEGTLFALLMSIFNGGGILGSELGALLTRMLGVTDVDFRNLGLLIVLCNLSSLLPLPFLRWIEAVETEAMETSKEGGLRVEDP